MSESKILANAIIASMESEPEQWIADRYTVTNKRTNVEVWIENIPVASLHMYQPYSVGFSLWDRWRIYRAIQKLGSLLMAKRLNDPNYGKK